MQDNIKRAERQPEAEISQRPTLTPCVRQEGCRWGAVTSLLSKLSDSHTVIKMNTHTGGSLEEENQERSKPEASCSDICCQ